MGKPNDQDRLRRARDYPYDIPRTSFLYGHDGLCDFDPRQRVGRTPVLAIGSNQSPLRLAQKFGPDSPYPDPTHQIPVERVVLDDFDVVYSAHISSYGAVPAMLQHSLGAKVELAITWLDQTQLTIMHESEMQTANYQYGTLENVVLKLIHDGQILNQITLYISSRGHLNHEGGAYSLAVIPCENRQTPAITTAEALDIVRVRTDAGQDADGFTLRLIDDAPYRRDIVEQISQDAVRFGYGYKILA